MQLETAVMNHVRKFESIRRGLTRSSFEATTLSRIFYILHNIIQYCEMLQPQGNCRATNGDNEPIQNKPF
jgi:hypothetical protein